jgi:hypothetical protein
MKASSVAILVLGFIYYIVVSPKIEQGEKRQKLVEQWNASNEANGSTCCFYSTRGLFSETLAVTLVGDTDRANEDSFVGEIVQGDAATNEMKKLGFKNVKCCSLVEEFRASSARPATGNRELDIQNLG